MRLTGHEKKPLDRKSGRHRRVARIVHASDVILGDLPATGQYDCSVADIFTDRTVNLIVWHGAIPPTWFQAFNPFMIFAFTPLVVALWARQEKRGSEPSTIIKMAVGCFVVALAYLIMVAAAWQAAGSRASWLWLVAFRRHHPRRALSLSDRVVAGVEGGTRARALADDGNVARHELHRQLDRWLAGGLWSGVEKVNFFLMIAVLAAVAGVVIAAFNGPLKPILGK